MRRRFIGCAVVVLLLSGAARKSTLPSHFGVLTSSRWAFGGHYRREVLAPVPNPHPNPSPQPRRDHPFDVAVSADGGKVYIGLLGSELQPGREVAVYDAAREEVIRRIPLKPVGETGPYGSGPYRLALHPEGRYLLVSQRFSNFTSVIDTHTDAVVSEIPLDFYAQGIVFDARGRRAYIANRYLDQVFVVDFEQGAGVLAGKMRVLGGLDNKVFLEKVQPILVRRCGKCHSDPAGEFYAGDDAEAGFVSALSHIRLGAPDQSRLLRAVLPQRHGGYADRRPKTSSHAMGTVVFRDPAKDEDYKTVAGWIRSASEGPGIPVGNPRSKPKVLALSTDGRWLFVGNTGTQDISIVSTKGLREVGAIYVQNVVNDLKVFHSSITGRDYLLVTTEGVGFGVGRERDPYGGESRDESNPAAQYSLHRDTATGRVLSKREQKILGPFDAVDGTAGIKFRDVQNDLVFIDIDALGIPDAPGPEGPAYLLSVNRYEAHPSWVRYTSDTAESTYGDMKGDIPPELMRVVGALPEKMAISGDRLFVTMQASGEIQQWRIDPSAADPIDYLTPVAVHPAGMQPIGIAAGRTGTPSEGRVYAANFLGGTLSVIDLATGSSREVVVDPGVVLRPVPDTDAERGEFFAHSAVFSSDGDSSCFHCHYLDMGDGRPWGVSQVLGQEYVQRFMEKGQMVIGGTMGVPQMRGLFGIQPFFYEGVLSVFEPRSMIMEHAPAEDFKRPVPGGDYTGREAHYAIGGVNDIQSGMNASTEFQSTLEERRDAMFRERSMRHFGKAFNMRDFQRFVGEWQAHEPRLLPNPFDRTNASVLRGRKIFDDPQVGCVSCHPPPHFAKKDFPDNPQQAMPPVVMFTERDSSFNLIGMNRLDALNKYARDLEPGDKGRVEEVEGHITASQLRGIWDRPPVFLHNGMARTLREVVATPGHSALRRFKYEPLLGGVPERPGRDEVGFNETFIFSEPSDRVRAHRESGARIGLDTHGGTSHLSARSVDDLLNYLNSIE